LWPIWNTLCTYLSKSCWLQCFYAPQFAVTQIRRHLNSTMFCFYYVIRIHARFKRWRSFMFFPRSTSALRSRWFPKIIEISYIFQRIRSDNYFSSHLTNNAYICIRFLTEMVRSTLHCLPLIVKIVKITWYDVTRSTLEKYTESIIE
jgi:hypothetical protein